MLREQWLRYFRGVVPLGGCRLRFTMRLFTIRQTVVVHRARLQITLISLLLTYGLAAGPHDPPPAT
jgi:hypothetical protein